MSLVYLDSSALVKLVVHEPARGGAAARRRAREILARIALVDVDRRTLAAAALIDPPAVRLVDAIHLATALAVRDDMATLVTYDRQLAIAAERADLPVLTLA